LAVVLCAIFLGVTYMQVQSVSPETKVLTREVRGPTTATEPGVEEPETPGRPAGTFVLQMTGGEVEFLPADPGEPIRVEATYDPESGELEESFEEQENGAWVHRVRFKGEAGSLKGLMREIMGQDSESVRIHLPSDVLMNLDVSIERGGGMVELGGLHLDGAEFNLTQGGVEMTISRPLQAPMSRLAIKATMGGGSFRSLGNASPRRLDFESSMGGFEIDLTGHWVGDSDISINSTMGGASILLPRDVNVAGLDTGRVELEEDEEVPRPTLTFSQSASMGGIDISYE
jgi:hypothetical protein